jgi:hypothetical protein
VERVRQARLRSGIHDHRVAGLGEHDRMTRPASGQEALEGLVDLAAIGTQRQVMVVVLGVAVRVIFVVVMVVVGKAAPDDPLVEKTQKLLQITLVKGRSPWVGIAVLRRRIAAIVAAGESAYAQPTVTHQVEFLWFEGCPITMWPARCSTRSSSTWRRAPPFATSTRPTPWWPGDIASRAPTIRVDGKDVDPAFIDPGHYTLRCRLFRSDSGIVRVPERQWIEDALR